eukprot:3760229-Pleurochrysis_carterae.AAC.1
MAQVTCPLGDNTFQFQPPTLHPSKCFAPAHSRNVTRQVSHAALRGDLVLNAASPTLPPRVPLTFFMPTGIARLANDAQIDPHGELAKLKKQFGAIFDSLARPFRVLPLSPAAATYAASDVWSVWAVHAHQWRQVCARGLGRAVLEASERRADEFRDGLRPRLLWDQMVAQIRAQRQAKKDAATRAAESAKSGAKSDAKSTVQSADKNGSKSGDKSGEKPKKKKGEKTMGVVSGPRCEDCG